MHTDLGTWRGAQADAVVRILKRAGLSPRTEDGIDGTRITVPAAQNDEAHQVLASSMDDIARAAGPPSGGAVRRERGTSGPIQTDADDGQALVTERLRNAAPLVGLVAALLLAAMIPAGAIRTTVFVFALVAFGVVWARRNGGGDDEYRPPTR